MPLEQVIPLTSKEGHQYLIQFSKFRDSIIPDNIVIDIIDVLIALKDNRGINNASTLFQMSGIIKNYLDENDVVLYCYCDNKEINKGKNKSNIPPQEYRSLLFRKMFDKKAGLNYSNELIIINDKINGDHYIHLISRASNKKYVELISDELSKFQK